MVVGLDGWAARGDHRRVTIAESLRCVPPLEAAEEAAYREGLALRALAAGRGPGWVEESVRAALESPHPFPRGEARIALQMAPPDAVVAALLGPLTSQSRRRRRRAMTLLPRLEASEVVRQLREWLPGASRQGKRAACVALAALGAEGGPLLKTLSADAEPAVARRAARALATMRARGGEAGRGQGQGKPSDVRPFGLHPPVEEPPARARSFAVAAFNFSYGVNLGVLIRSAEAAGAEAVWIVGRDFYYRPSTKGSDWWLPVEVVGSPAACLERAQREGYAVVALQQGAAAAPVFSARWPDRPLIVAGNEGDGLPEAFLAAAALQVALPVYGRIDSLNVAVAASVAMYAFVAQREAAPVLRSER